MAKHDGHTGILGTIGKLSYYKRRDSDEIFIRRKGGPSAEDIKNSPKFVNARKNNNEFGCRAKAASNIRRALQPLKMILDFNLNSKLMQVLKPMQELDSVSPWGKRGVELTKHGSLLHGLSLNKKFSFDSIVTNRVSVDIMKDELTATFQLPDLVPLANFLPSAAFSFCRFVVCLGEVPDVTISGTDPEPGYYIPVFSSSTTAWKATKEKQVETEFKLKLAKAPSSQSFSLIAAIGIEFGRAAAINDIDTIQYVGAGKILRVL